ncbi:class II fumarate hydratase [Halalkalibacter urbisdiaboli]|uniref:class II fumarate hydratase n=1 Tax=Halalkalibacter urbisdiaboli TaxID=1960589 RepID=UPI001A988E34|nr:class II fumarate hydratase [Halalkalibacter urbisdiaboli]
MEIRVEKDTIGEIHVPANKFWGAQTQRSLENFKIGKEKMPIEVIEAFAYLKKAAANVNGSLSNLEQKKVEAITYATNRVLQENLSEHFPLVVWQTGSGTQSNMNVNEVLAYIANDYLKQHGMTTIQVHPNDDVNRSQSSNDTFPTAMHIAVLLHVEKHLLPALNKVHKTLKKKENQYKDVIKIGRTHLQDATPLTFGQEISGWVHMIELCTTMIKDSLEPVRQLAIGGTAVGTGLNAPEAFGEKVAQELTRLTGTTMHTAENYFHALTSHSPLVHFHGSLKALAGDLFKIANDIRLLASGPRSGIGELRIPTNEPGSSIMPGKVNPTQSEALTMVASQIFGNDATIGFAASQGHFQLNVFKPVIIYNVLQSLQLLSDGLVSFNDNCLEGLEAIEETMTKHLHDSLMLVTALNPHIGYEKAALIAKTAYAENTTLKEAAEKLGILSAEQFDTLVIPQNMISPLK